MRLLLAKLLSLPALTNTRDFVALPQRPSSSDFMVVIVHIGIGVSAR